MPFASRWRMAGDCDIGDVPFHCGEPHASRWREGNKPADRNQISRSASRRESESLSDEAIEMACCQGRPHASSCWREVPQCEKEN
jgi:hypothetical protein